MKRVLTSLIALLLLLVGVGVANAAVGDVITTLEGISAGKVYTIEAPRGKLVLNAAKTGIVSDYTQSGENTGAYSTDPGADQWAVVPYKNFYLLYNVAKAQFLKPSGSFGAVASDAFLWSLMMASNPTGDYVFKFKDVSDGQTGGNTLNNNNSGGWPCNGWSTEDDGNRLKFTEAGTMDVAVGEVDWSVVDGDQNVKYNIKGAAVAGSTMGLDFSLSYPGVVLDPASIVVSAEGNNVTSTYTVDESVLPFKYSKSFDDATWYRMTVLRSPEKNCKFDGTNINNVTGNVDKVTGEYAFAFVGDPFGYNIYNYAAGKDKPIGPATSEGNPRLAVGDAAAAGTFVFEYSPAGNGNQIFRFADGELAYINDVGSYLGVWRTTGNYTDGGSNFKFTEVDFALVDPAAALQELEDEIDAIKTPLNAESYKTNLQGTERGGVTSETDKAALQELFATTKAAFDSETATDEEKMAAYNELKAAIAACPADNPIVDGYYYIYAAFDGLPLSYRTVDEADYAYKANWSDPATSLELGLVYNIKKVGENAYTVQNVKTGKYLGAYNADYSPSDKGSFAFQTEEYTTYILPWRETHNYLESNASYGAVTDAIDFCLFSESTLEHEYSGRWTGSGWNIHSDLGDIVAHAWRLLPIITTTILQRTVLSCLVMRRLPLTVLPHPRKQKMHCKRHTMLFIKDTKKMAKH